MDAFERRYRQLRHATVARSALDVIAIIFLGCGFAFWSVAFWQLLAPPGLLSLLSIQVAVLSLVYSLATPLLWSALVPSTPAGQLLQKTQWRTFGFAAIVGAALYLTYQAEWMIEAWLSAQPGVTEGRLGRGLAISLAIGFILIPALAWTQLTPERWMQQIQQAHAVKKLELQQKGDLAILKASLIRAEMLAARGWANLLPLEKEEAIGSLRGLLMAQADTMRSVVKTLGLSADLERSIMGDEEIAGELDYVTQAIDVLPDIAPRAAPTPPRAIEPTARQDAAPASPQSHPAPAALPAPPQSAAVSGCQPQYAAEYHAAKGKLSGTWSSADLGAAIGKSPRSALERIYAWQRAGLVVAERDGKGAYYFTEREAP